MRIPNQSRTGRNSGTFQRCGVLAQDFVVVAVAIGIVSVCAGGQDRRTVAEPVIPPVCILLKAAMSAPHGIAAPDEMWVDTERIQAAIDHCPGGHAVELSSEGTANAFLSGSLRLRKGVTLLIDKDVTLYGSRNPRDYDVYRGSCGTVDESRQRGCHALIVADHASHSGVMGEGVIDGRGGASLLVNGAEQPANWWFLAEEARLWGHQQVPRLIDTNHSNDFTVYEVTLRNSPGVHLGFHNGNGMTVWGVKIDTPQSARNADGIDPSSAKNVTVEDSYIRSGNDNVDIEPSRNVSILHNHFYWGHGMSIGSETHGGVRDVLVSDLSLDGPENGLRIQSSPGRGGVVKDVTYEGVCMRSSKAPIGLNSNSTNSQGGGARTPVYEDIVLRNVRVSGGGTLELLGADDSHHIHARFDGVELTDAHSKYNFVSRHADAQQGVAPANFQLVGEDSTGQGRQGGIPSPIVCDARFVPFPGDAARVQSASVKPPTVAKPEKAEEAAPLGEPAYAASYEKPMVKQPVALMRAPAVAFAVSRPVQARCLRGRCGSVQKRRVAQSRQVRLHCRKTYACKAVQVRHAGAQSSRHGKGARLRAVGHSSPSSQADLIARFNAR